LALLQHMRAYANSVYGVTYDAQGNRVRLPWATSEAPLLMQGLTNEH